MIPSLFVLLWPLLWKTGRPDHYWGIGKPFLYSFPFIILCVYTIARLKANKAHVWSYAVLAFLIPAFGFTNLQNAQVALDKKFLLPHMGAEHTVNFLQHYNKGIAPLILGAGIAGCMLPNKKMGKTILGLGLLSALHHYSTYEAAVSLLFHNVNKAGIWLNIGILIALLIPMLSLLCAVGKTKFRSLLWGLFGVYLLGPASWFHLRNVPIGTAHPTAPTGEPSIGVSISPADPSTEMFSEQLDRQGSYYRQRAKWWCSEPSNLDWKQRKRETTALSSDAQTIITLEHFQELYHRSTTRVSLIGHASPSFSVLKQHTKNPAVHIWLDQPPIGVRYAAINNESFSWLGPLGTISACAIWLSGNNSFGYLFSTMQKLQQNTCSDGIFVVLGTPQKDPSKWTSPFPCPITKKE